MPTPGKIKTELGAREPMSVAEMTDTSTPAPESAQWTDRQFDDSISSKKVSMANAQFLQAYVSLSLVD